MQLVVSFWLLAEILKEKAWLFRTHFKITDIPGKYSCQSPEANCQKLENQL